MSRLNAIVRRLDNRINPIVVKELRQTSRGKFLIVILLGFLFIQLSVTGGVSFFASAGAVAGPSLFLALFGFLTAASALLIPAYAGFRLAQERADTNVDLLFSTALKPASIVWGKTLSSAILATLIYSVCMPFIVMTYMLRGIDLPSAFLLMGISYFAVLLATQFGILIGCMPANRVIKGIAGLFGLFTIFGFLMGGVGYIINSLMTGTDILARLMSSQGLLTALGVFAVCLFLGAGLFLLSTAFISPASSNRAFIPRLYFTAIWFLSLAAVVVWAEISSSYDPIVGWMYMQCLIFGWGLTISVSERDRVGLRVRRQIPRSGALRVLSYLYYSGSAGGVFWASIGIVLTFLAGLGAIAAVFDSIPSTSDFEGTLYGLVFRTLNAWIAAMGAFLIHRALLKNRISNGYTWVSAYLIQMIFGLLWVMYMISANIASPARLASGPMTIFTRGIAAVSADPPVTAAGLIAFILGCACLPWIARQIAGFKPYSRSTTARQE